MRPSFAVPASQSRTPVSIAALILATVAALLASPGAQAQQWFDVPPRPDHPNVSIRIGGQPDSRQASGNAKGKIELRYGAVQTIPGSDKGAGRYNRAVTDVLFNCARSQVGFLAATSYYMNDNLVAAISDNGSDESQVQFVRFADGSPQMQALRAACGK